jgi:hypothetical protein
MDILEPLSMTPFRDGNKSIHLKVNIQNGILLKVLRNEVAMVSNGRPCKLAGSYISGAWSTLKRSLQKLPEGLCVSKYRNI